MKIQKNSYSKTIELLDKNQQVSGVNSGLNVVDLMKMVDYYTLKRTEISNAITTLEEKEKKLGKQLANLYTKLETNTKNEEKSSNGKLIVQVMNEIAGNADFEINYLTNAATWKSFYDLRANSIGEPIEMIYKAEVVPEQTHLKYLDTNCHKLFLLFLKITQILTAFGSFVKFMQRPFRLN